MKRYSLLLVLFFMLQVYMFSQPYVLNTVISQISIDDLIKLLRGEVLTRSSKSSSNRELKYLPSTKNTKVVREYIQEINPTILHEILVFISNEVLEEKINATLMEQLTEREGMSILQLQQHTLMLHYFNVLRNVETFADIEYTNIKDKNVHPLFNTSNRIVSKEETVNIPVLDSVYFLSQRTMNEFVFVLQDMPPFGEVTSKYEYTYNSDTVSFIGKNLTFITYKGFVAVRPNDMFITSQIVKTDKGILVYGLGVVKISGLGIFFGDVISNSFISRMVGFFEWINSK